MHQEMLCQPWKASSKSLGEAEEAVGGSDVVPGQEEGLVGISKISLVEILPESTYRCSTLSTNTGNTVGYGTYRAPAYIPGTSAVPTSSSTSFCLPGTGTRDFGSPGTPLPGTSAGRPLSRRYVCPLPVLRKCFW
jgi:hypothetical protein